MVNHYLDHLGIKYSSGVVYELETVVTDEARALECVENKESDKYFKGKNWMEQKVRHVMYRILEQLGWRWY